MNLMTTPIDIESPRAHTLSLIFFKKICRQFALTLLTLGASLILGLLSFGGMYALWPALVPALTGFFLSVIYEGEIYTQNLERAFEKIFNPNYFKKQLAKAFLKNHFQDNHEATVNL